VGLAGEIVIVAGGNAADAAMVQKSVAATIECAGHDK